jgi:hypothetical protein
MPPEVVVDPKHPKLLADLLQECPRYAPQEVVPESHVLAHQRGELVHGRTPYSHPRVVCVTRVALEFVGDLEITDSQSAWNKELNLGHVAK